MKIDRTPGPVGESRADKNRRLQAERDAERVAKNTAKLSTVPLRMLKLLARADAYQYDGVTARVIDGSLDPANLTDPQLRLAINFSRRPGTSDAYTDTKNVYLFGDEWDIESIEREFDDIDAEKAAEARRIEIARVAYDRMSQEERDALGLHRRP